ncbi:TetR/AcrR family transcriptional regulator [Nocardiopsis sp. EMB25]|uniref:TetR/AcrR family transcriptional regulator n=1 Tax=Nocardiopsis TaxID=2013 RepID=UPI0003475AB0|nr:MULTISPECIES: TetR/AcrR family transcriptional regulator [Nocardiopsis]MCY9782846.1 TetR/AcrR family transcriptional regulator [Nocardiopsis sp. EMB25]
MRASQTARERARAELTREIIEAARRHLATEGAVGLSLRAVARELGMASSAVYRYFPSKDDLLTALIIDGYNALGEAVEEGDATQDRADFTGRWRASCHAARAWALAHPHEYALLFGSPVPGYQAPQDTVGPAVRDTAVLGRIAAEAHRDGALGAGGDLPPVPEPLETTPIVRELFLDSPDEVVARALSAWAGLYGWIGFEVFGQLDGVVGDRAAAFDQHVARLGAMMGLTGP